MRGDKLLIIILVLVLILGLLGVFGEVDCSSNSTLTCTNNEMVGHVGSVGEWSLLDLFWLWGEK